MRRKLSKFISNNEASHELLYSLERFLYDRPGDYNEKLHFDDMEIERYALESAQTHPRTALHKVLYDLAYIEFYLYLFDDVDWVNEYKDFSDYASEMFRIMGIAVPQEFLSSDDEEILEGRRKYRKLFLAGLHSIVNSAFAIAWHQKKTLFELNCKLASKISPLRKSEVPILADDGRLPRIKFPTWIINAVQARDRGMCHYCGKPVVAVFNNGESPHIDHMVALAVGGGNDPTNLVLSCEECNTSKGARKFEIRDHFYWPSTSL